MPKDKRTRKYSTRMRPYRRTKKSMAFKYDPNTRMIPNLERNVFGFPNEITTKVRYADVYTLISTSGSKASNIFRMNSINDPDYSGVGHQALWNDQLAAVYNRYVVLGSKITATFTLLPDATTTTQPTGPMAVGLLCESDTTTSSTLSTLLETNNGTSGFVTNAFGGKNTITLTGTYSPMKNIGFSPLDDTVSAGFNANPSQQYYATIWAIETGLGTPSAVNVMVKIEYTIKCSRQIDPTGS